MSEKRTDQLSDNGKKLNENQSQKVVEINKKRKKPSEQLSDIPENFLERDDILDKVKALIVLPDGIHTTIDLAASYYEVDRQVIKNHIFSKRYKDKFEEDGVRTIKGEELSILKKQSPDLVGKRAPSLTLIPRRALLRLGFLIEDSEVADQVREYALHLDQHYSPYRKILEPPIEFKGKRILLTDQVSQLLGTTTAGVQKAKKRHSRLLQKDVHFLDIEGEDLKELKVKYPNRIGRKATKITGYTLEGFIILMNQSRDGDRDAIPDVASYFGANPEQFNVIKPVSKEGNFRKQLQGAFADVYQIERQVVIDKHRLDFYFPEFKLVVEFDEDYHKLSTQQIRDKNREKQLMKKYGFTFVRVSEHEELYIAINRILLAIKEIEIGIFYKSS